MAEYKYSHVLLLGPNLVNIDSDEKFDFNRALGPAAVMGDFLQDFFEDTYHAVRDGRVEAQNARSYFGKN